MSTKPQHSGQVRLIKSIDCGPNHATISVDSDVSLKDRLDDALRRLASLQQDLKEIRREITSRS